MPKVIIPKPLLVTVDDVGWWNGRDGSARNQPFRTGMQRDHVPDDYRALAALGKGLNMRIPAGLVLCEWDGTGLLKDLPSATWMGRQWQPPSLDPSKKEKAAAIIADAAAWIEPALHGIGHEYWFNGILDRSEFHTADGSMRPPDDVKKHLEYFFKLMAQNRLDTKIRLFIPPALNHSFGNGDAGFQKIAGRFGIQYVSLVFSRAKCHAAPQYPEVGWENRVVLMDRGQAPIAWNRVAPQPEFDPNQPILPLHWANLLHRDPKKNMQVIAAWIRAIEQKIEENNLIPARDIAQCLTQFLNHTRSTLQSTVHHRGEEIIVHMDWIREVPASALADAVFFQIPQAEASKIHISGTRKITTEHRHRKTFYRVGLPSSGKLIFRFSKPSI